MKLLPVPGWERVAIANCDAFIISSDNSKCDLITLNELIYAKYATDDVQRISQIATEAQRDESQFWLQKYNSIKTSVKKFLFK